MQSWVGGWMKEFRRAHSGFDCWFESNRKLLVVYEYYDLINYNPTDGR